MSLIRNCHIENNQQSLDKSFWIAITIFILFLVLRRSAAYFGIPPLYGGEITIILFAALFLGRDKLRTFCTNPYGLVSLTFAFLPIPYFIVQYRNVGTDAIMYSSVAYYAVFWYFGYSIISTTERQNLFISVLYYAILLSNIHFLVSRVIHLEEIPPLINGVSLLGHTDSCYIYFALGIAYALIFSYKLGLIRTIVLLCSSILGHVLITERGSQLGILGVLLTLFIFRKIWLKYNSYAIQYLIFFGGSSLVLVLLLWPKSGFVEKTAFQVDLIISTFSHSQNTVRAGTKEHRLEMWNQIIENTLNEGPVLGQGVKGPLVDVAFRNPHNSFITIFGRFGIVGLLLAITIYFAMPVHNMIVMTRISPPAQRVRRAGDTKLQQAMLLYLCFVPAFMGAALFGPTLVSPFSALVCNFIYGASLRCCDIVLQRSQAPAVIRCVQMTRKRPNCRWLCQRAQNQPTLK